MNKFTNFISSFVREEDGAQVVEYALIIALVSIVLALALANSAGGGGLAGAFAALVGRVTTCLTGPACT